MSVDDSPRTYHGGIGGRPELAPAGELAVRQERRADAVTLRLAGELDQATCALLDRELEVQANPSEPLVLDLAGLEFIDSSGLATLTRALQRARESGRQLSIEASWVVSRLLEMSETRSPGSGSMTGLEAASHDLY